jgi:sporulation protein YlmC with PRC-barrel domain
VTTDRLDRLGGPFDALLHLMDRQLIDADGRLLGKVDDIELTQTDAGLTITALLTGPAALLGRLGGRLGDELLTKWEQMRRSEPRRTWPWRIPMDRIDHVDSAVHLDVRRDDLLERDRESFRLGNLAGMTVHEPDGRRVGQVLDARFEATDDGDLVLQSLLVGRGGPGSLLGYDRRPDQGPVLVRRIVRLWHRDTRVVDITSAQILWNIEQIRIPGTLQSIGERAIDM